MKVGAADIVFKKGLNVFCGRNGQGKSTVLEAAAYCLYGRKRGDTYKDYIKNGTDGFEVWLEASLSKDPTDIIVFDYGATKSKSTKKIQYKDKTYNGEECDTFLATLFDKTMTSKVVFSLQDNEPITRLTPSENRDIFKKIFNSDFDDMVQMVKADIDKTKNEVLTTETEIKLLNEKEYKPEEIIPVDQSRLAELKSELLKSQASEVLKEKYKLYLNNVEELQKNQQSIESIGRSKTLQIAKKEEQSLKIFSLKRKIESVLVKEEKEKLDKQYEKIVELNKLLEKEKEELSNKRTELIELGKSKVRLQEQLDTEKVNLLSDISILEKYIEAHKKGKCETCGQDCDVSKVSEYETSIAQLSKSLEHKQSQIFTIKAEIEDLRSKVQNIYAPIDIKKEEIRLEGAEKDKIVLGIKDMENDIKSHQNSVSVIESTVIPEINKSIQEYDEAVLGLQKKNEVYETWIKENKVSNPVNVQDREVKIIQDEIDTFVGQIQANLEKERFNTKLIENQKIDKKQIQDLNDRLHILEIKKANLQGSKEIFELDFPDFINLKACTILESYMNNFFSTVKDDFQITIRLDKKGVSFYYKADNEPDWNPLKMVSGFETAMVTVGFNVAIAKAFGSEILVLDEPDKDADSISSVKLFDTILNLGSFEQSIVITHEADSLNAFKENGTNIYLVDKGKFTVEV